MGDDGEELPVGGPKQRTVLALLSVEPGRQVTTDALTMAVWGDEVPDRALRSLSTYVSNLRRVLGDVIDTGTGTYALCLDRSQIDSCAFADAVDAAGLVEGSDGVARYREALSLWTGIPFSGLDGFGAFREETQRLDALRLVAEHVVIESDIETGDAASVVPHVDALTREFPFDEGLRGLHMRALYRSDRQADALASFNSFRSRLADELGLDPSRELQDLELRILQHDESLDLRRPELPVLGRVSGLPSPASTFIGRESEIGELVELCSRDRLVTLSGVGGVGKTRLAIEVARQCLPGFVDGVFFIDLIEVSDPELVTRRFLSVLEIVERPDRPAVESLVQGLSGRRCLLVVDNCEHVVDGVAGILAALIPACPDVHVTATSRIRLGVAGEELFELGGLPTGQEGEADLAESEAALLFADRARHARRDFIITPENETVVGGICRTLDGIPLAIELAAARVRVMTTGEIAGHLSDRFAFLTSARNAGPDRHRTLESMIDWSYDLLTESDQQLFRLLGVFRGGFNLDALQAISTDPDVEVADALERLVDASLVTVDITGSATRYRLLETVREYATARLEANGETDNARARHLAHYASLGEAANRGMRHGYNEAPVTAEEHRFWFSAMGLDFANLRHALDWALEVGNLHDALSVITPLGFYLVMEVRFTEAIEILDSVLDRDACPTTPLQCESICRRALCLGNIGDDRAEAAVDEAEQAVRRLHLPSGYVSRLRVQLAEIRGDIIGALAHSEEALASAEANDHPRIAVSFYQVAELALLVGEIDSAVELAERLDAEGGDDYPWITLILRASIAAYRQRHQEALNLARNAITASEDAFWEGRAKRYTSNALLNLGHLDEARAIGEEREPFLRRFLASDVLERTLILLSLVALRGGDSEHAKTRLRETINSARQRRDTFMLWTAFHATAEWLAETGDPDTAAVLLGHCAAVTEQHRYAPQALNCVPLVTIETLADILDPERLDVLAAEGASAETDELTRQVLHVLTS
jgi:predicted ATPase/DNA-binding SARP family transcriptional activator